MYVLDTAQCTCENVAQTLLNMNGAFTRNTELIDVLLSNSYQLTCSYAVIHGLINYTDTKAFVGFSLKWPAGKFSGINWPSY